MDNKFENRQDNDCCHICKCYNNVRFVEIANCMLCEDCDNDLAESFNYAAKIDREDFPEY